MRNVSHMLPWVGKPTDYPEFAIFFPTEYN